MDALNMSGFDPGFFVDISLYLALKEQMLACHHSQLAHSKGKDFAPLGDLMRQQCQARGSQAGVSAAEAYRARHAFKRGRA